MWATWLVVAGLVCGQAAEGAGAKDNAELKSTVTRLVKQLDDAQAAKRDAAEKELVALGPAALELLPNITRQTPAEVKERLTRVRKQLENAVAETSTKPTRVTLKGPLKLRDAIKEIEKQTGNKIIDYREEFNQQARDVEITGEFQDLPFWEVVDKLLDQGELTTYAFSGQRGALAFVARNAEELARSGRGTYAGMFRFEPLRTEATRDLRNPENHGLRLFLDVAWEPRLQPIILTQALADLKITDDKGNELAIDGREGEIEIPVDGDSAATEMYIPLQLPSRDVKKVASLKGKLQVLAPGRIETFEFKDLEKVRNAEQKRAAATVTLDQVRKNQELFEVRMRVKFDAAANALESHRDWIYQNPAYLVDAAGERLDNVGLEATLQEQDQVGISYQFVAPDGLKGFKFVYTTPVSLIKMPVEFELKDVELP